MSLRSRVGVGTVFAIDLPRVERERRAVLPAATAPRSLGGARVLVVDNDAAALEAVAGLLRGWGCAVSTATDRASADRSMAAAPAELWLFDYHLDAGDTGVAMARDLARHHGARPTLIVSADGGATVRGDVLEAGHALLSKPIKPLALKSVLDRLLAAREVRGEATA